MYTILKPEIRRCMGKLEPYLENAGFNILSRHPVLDWESLAREIYSPQILSDPIFASELSVYLWLTKSLFGNNAVTFRLSREGGTKRNLEDLTELKNRFRKDIITDLDEPLNFIINLNKLKFDPSAVIGRKGVLKVDDSFLLDEGLSEGCWDFFFFKYIHTPDPDIEIYERELYTLSQNGIFDRGLTEEQWRTMKEIGSFVLPLERA